MCIFSFFFPLLPLYISRLLISSHMVLLGHRTEQGEELLWALGQRCFLPPNERAGVSSSVPLGKAG